MVSGAYWLYNASADGRYTSKWMSMVMKPEDSFLVFADKGQWEFADKLLAVDGFRNVQGYNDFQMSQWEG